jgi:hypothetical protein
MQENEIADASASADTSSADTSETSTASNGDAAETQQQGETNAEEITYHAVEKDGQISAIWEMQGRRHLRTIDPRSRQGQEILRLYTAEHHE